ncbi:MAG: sigma-70 family RNA polymerase sigma factor [Armatimonadetes bacterium]|nr:sigma-70 family RNA polymerase sigma factor [Armatimonadota bacterium]
MNDPAMSDGEWERPEVGDIDFDALIDRYHKKIFNVLLRMVGDFHEAADLTQDVFVQAYRALPTFRGDSKIYTWLYRIAVNRGKNRMKQITRTTSVVAGSIDDPIEAEEGLRREVPDQSHVPERVLQQRELQAVVNQEINGLPPDFRLVVILRDLEGLSYRDMAEVIGISLEAVKSRLFRARSQLRERLRPYLSNPGGEEPADSDGSWRPST